MISHTEPPSTDAPRALSIRISSLSKAYGTHPVLKDVTIQIDGPGIYCLMAPSGSGKTTLFRILMGLETQDQGNISVWDRSADPPAPVSLSSLRISAVFQEDRLIEFMTPLENTALVLPGRPSRSMLFTELARLLPEESLTRPVSTLSGGMRRRCALMRALLSPSDLLLLDEPFTGLDEKTKKEAVRCLLEKAGGRPVLMTTHSAEEASLLHAAVLRLPDIPDSTESPAP